MSVLDRLHQPTTGPLPRLLLPEGDDPRVQEAALVVAAKGFARPVLIGDAARLRALAADRGQDSGTIDVIDPADAVTAALVEWYAMHSGVAGPVAERMLRQSDTRAAALLATGQADALLTGAIGTTHDVLVACGSVIGLAPGATLASSFFLMETADGRSFLFADCAVNPNPDARELAEIARQTAGSARAIFGWAPRVAMLSFSTHGSADHPAVDKVRAATALARAADPTLCIDGELQADAAVDIGVAVHKLAEIGPVAGQANVLIFPDLDAGNIAYKLVRALGGARAIGVILQGYAKPVADASRGVTVEELVATAAVLASLVPQPAMV